MSEEKLQKEIERLEKNRKRLMAKNDEYASYIDILSKKLERTVDALIEIGDKFEGLPPGDIANEALADAALIGA